MMCGKSEESDNKKIVHQKKKMVSLWEANVNIGCQLDRIQNPLEDKTRGIPVRSYLDQIN